MTPAFLDANIPIYSAGRPHPLKQPSVEVLELVADHRGAFLTDAEVLQELLHRYMALRMWPAQGKPVFTRFSDLMRQRVEPVYAVDVEDAVELADTYRRLDARDLVHLAVMIRLGVRSIVTADRGFDAVAGIERLDPARIGTWRASVVA